ncbi:MAG: hypothetical protein IPN87_04965 [Saprospiraceae bacterium]|nr:hypothetical protein [Candidatus Brachybacter algidus]
MLKWENNTSNEEELSGIFDIEFDGDGNIYMLGSGERLTADSLFIYLALGKLKSDGNFDSHLEIMELYIQNIIPVNYIWMEVILKVTVRFY